MLRKGFVSPSRGVETAASPIDKNKFMTPDEVERLIRVARVTDRCWGKLPCLIVLAFHTGMRAGSLLMLKWQDIDLDAQTAYVRRTKNGDPYVATLTDRCMRELKRLRRGAPDEFVFAGRNGGPYRYRARWNKTAEACRS
jgi:integrase